MPAAYGAPMSERLVTIWQTLLWWLVWGVVIVAALAFLGLAFRFVVDQTDAGSRRRSLSAACALSDVPSREAVLRKPDRLVSTICPSERVPVQPTFRPFVPV